MAGNGDIKFENCNNSELDSQDTIRLHIYPHAKGKKGDYIKSNNMHYGDATKTFTVKKKKLKDAKYITVHGKNQTNDDNYYICEEEVGGDTYKYDYNPNADQKTIKCWVDDGFAYDKCRCKDD